jgi:hypothetical protein
MGNEVFANSAAFPGALTGVTLPDGLTSVSGNPFSDNPNLATVDISACAGLADIGLMFSGMTSLTSLDLSGTRIASLAADAFAGCVNLASLKLPAALTAIGAGAFTGCSNLVFDLGSSANFTLQHNDKALVTAGGVLAAFPAYESELSGGALVLGNGLTAIGPSVFYSPDASTAMQSATVPATVISVGAYAFGNQAGLVAFVWSGTAGTSLGNYAFYRCPNLSTLTLPPSLESIGNYAFSGCRALINFPLGSFAALASIGAYAFSTDTAIGSPDFTGALDLSGMTSLTEIQYHAFSGKNISSLILPASLKTLGANAFWNCPNLVQVKWPRSAAEATVGNSAFYYCSALAKVELPDRLVSHNTSSVFRDRPIAIGEHVFYECPALQVLVIRTGATGSGPDDLWPGLYSGTDIRRNAGLKIYVPAASVDYFKATTNGDGFRYSWVYYTDYIYPDTALAGDGNDPDTW